MRVRLGPELVDKKISALNAMNREISKADKYERSQATKIRNLRMLKQEKTRPKQQGAYQKTYDIEIVGSLRRY